MQPVPLQQGRKRIGCQDHSSGRQGRGRRPNATRDDDRERTRSRTLVCSNISTPCSAQAPAEFGGELGRMHQRGGLLVPHTGQIRGRVHLRPHRGPVEHRGGSARRRVEHVLRLVIGDRDRDRTVPFEIAVQPQSVDGLLDGVEVLEPERFEGVDLPPASVVVRSRCRGSGWLRRTRRYDRMRPNRWSRPPRARRTVRGGAVSRAEHSRVRCIRRRRPPGRTRRRPRRP